ncbi:hypothetical protein B296_00052956 [Ensete ventricosum]|uniref:beta-galactosidase n=1 Tax=Ensete ventricosum TaxID=4639 RepID=A0A426YAB6_ENSVE|nr:hypothetical protein B296_00052956 [Ensete ventricosum]
MARLFIWFHPNDRRKMEMSKCCLLLLVASSLYYIVCSTTVSHDGRALVIDGQRRVIFSGSIHYPRSTPEVIDPSTPAMDSLAVLDSPPTMRTVPRSGRRIGPAGGPYIVTSYDYDAPLDEYGNIRQPKWGHLKELHASVKQMEEALTYGKVFEDHLGNGLTFSGDGLVPGCFLSNQNSTSDANISFQGTNYFLPAWSVSILPDCKEEVYNTAKIGLDGEVRKLQLDEERWYSGAIQTYRPFTCKGEELMLLLHLLLKTTFQAPLGSEPVVVDLLGLGKGEAWVNGNSLGRFWPNFTAGAYGCNQCDYRGNFQSDKCRTACGEASQRWYHVPRSFLKRGEPNTLTLFEEAGGDPSHVNFQTVTVGTACNSAGEGDVLSLSCQGGRTISTVDFATFGEANGTCGAYVSGGCGSDEAVAILKDACLGRESCSIKISDKIGTSCAKLASPWKLVAQVTCS